MRPNPRALWALVLLAGCTRDLSTPPQAPPGKISGRVVYAIPGRSESKPAAGAVVSLLGSGLSTTANQAGTFSLSPLEDTTGLLLFSNDERFVAHATSPETKLPKRYLARVSGQVTEPKLEQLRQGLRLDEEEAPTRPAKARQLPDARVELTLTEGRHHQVKRMLGAVGLPVLALHREAIGTLQVDVPEGQCRLLSEDEVRTLLGYVAGNG